MTVKKEDISCPTCGKKGSWTPENKFRPFCSSRCKLIDLGDWADEKHRVPGEPANPSESPDKKEDFEE
jgi:endogenous inhibitor of DNA gyrase (YacG/DUF329 family)